MYNNSLIDLYNPISIFMGLPSTHEVRLKSLGEQFIPET